MAKKFITIGNFGISKLGFFLLLGVVAALIAIPIVHEYGIKPHEPVWHPKKDEVDLGVVPIPVSGEGVDGPVEDAIKDINDWVGCEVLRYSKHAVNPVITIENAPQDVEEPGHRGAAYWHFDGSRWTASIKLKNLFDIRKRFLGAQHELLHALGLAHDSFSASMMFKNVTEYSEANPPPKITEKDLEALKSEYCPD